METLKELARFTTSVTNKESYFFDEQMLDTKLYQLYDGVLSGRYNNDEEASRELYGMPASNVAFQKLKERFRKRLTAQVLQYDYGRQFVNQYARSLYQAMVNLLAGQVLSMKGYDNASIDLLKLALEISVRYQFTDLELLTLRKLSYNAAFNGKRTLQNFYSEKIKLIEEKLQVELLSDDYNQKLIVGFIREADPATLLPIAEEGYNKLKALINNFTSHTLNLNFYRLAIRYYHLKKDHKKVLRICDTALRYLHDNTHLAQQVRFGEFALHKMENAMLMRNYDTGTKVKEQCEKYFAKSYQNKLIFYEYYFLLCMHTKQYDQALKLYTDVITDKYFGRLKDDRVEKWQLFEAYLRFVLPERMPKARRRNALFTDLTVIDKDKTGYFTAAIFAEIILSIQWGDYDTLLTKHEALKAYFQRHVVVRDTPRSYYFAKLLHTLIRYDFNLKKAEEIGLKHWKKLQPERKNNDLESIEVIPYDKLWPMLLKIVEQNEKIYVE
jgi:hypothetical protein